MPYFENHSKQLYLRVVLQSHITKPIDDTPAIAAMWIRNRMDNIPQFTNNTGLQQGLGEPKVNHAKIEVFGRFNPFNPADLGVHADETGFFINHIREGKISKGFRFIEEAEEERRRFSIRIHLRKMQ